MQTNLEASLGCLQIEAPVGCPQNKAHPYQIQENENSVEDFPVLKNGQNEDSGSVSVASPSSLGSDSLSPPDEGYYKPMHHQAFCMWSTFHPDFHKLQQSQWNGHESFSSMNREHHFPNESRVQYLPFRMFSQCHPPEFQFQDFQYFVVIDFEATCDKDRNPHPQEIIEFPSVLVNSVTGQLEASFQTYVRPVYHQHLSEFCKELTGIQQVQVDRGVPLSEALLMHDKWLEDKGIKHTNFAVVTWSNWDCRVMLESECRFKHIRKPPYFNRWINLKVPFNEVFGGVRCNLKEAVQLAGLAWEGRAHCGLDDARNTARLLTHIMHRGFRFAITNLLVWHTSENRFPFHSPDRPPMLPSHFHHKPKPFAMPFFQFYPRLDPSKARGMYCFCGVKSSKRMVRKPGPDHGSVFFGCGNWTAARGAVCPYFERAS